MLDIVIGILVNIIAVICLILFTVFVKKFKQEKEINNKLEYGVWAIMLLIMYLAYLGLYYLV